MGTIFKKGKNWYIDFYCKGKRLRRKVEFYGTFVQKLLCVGSGQRSLIYLRNKL